MLQRVPGASGVSLEDVVYGLDIGITKLSGAARVLVWVAPLRKEAMVEVRAF